MAGGGTINSLELGRKFWRKTNSWFGRGFGFAILTSFVMLVSQGLIIYVEMSQFADDFAPIQTWSFFPVLLLGASMAVTFLVIFIGSKDGFGISNKVYLGLLFVSMYVASFGTFEFLFKTLMNMGIRNSQWWAVALVYPLIGFVLFILIYLVIILLAMTVVAAAAEKISRTGPSAPPIFVFYVVALPLAVLLLRGFDVAFEEFARIFNMPGVLPILVVAILCIAFVLFPRMGHSLKPSITARSRAAAVAAAIVYWLRCAASVFDTILADNIAQLFTGWKSILSRYLAIFAAFFVPSLAIMVCREDVVIPLYFLSIPLARDVVALLLLIPVIVAAGIYRRSMWLEADRQKCIRSSDDELGRNSRTRVDFDSDLRGELLFAVFLLFFLTAPTLLWVISGLKTLTDLFGLMSYFGAQLVKDVPILQWLPGAETSVKPPIVHSDLLGGHAALAVRIFAELTILAILFETLNRSSAEARQREEFLDVRDSVNRLDPVEERKLFLEVVTDWGVVERVAPYDPARLMVVVSRIFDPAIMSDIRICLGAARIAGYQLAGAVIAKVLTTELDNKDVKDLDHMWSAFRQAPSVYAHRGYDFDALSHTRRARQLIVNALLEGLQLRLEQMDGIAPDTDLVVKALIEIRDTDHVEIFAELEIQLDGLTRANRIVFLVKDLSSEDDYIAEAARRELQQLVNRKHVGLYRAMLKSDDPDVWGEGATLLGVLGIDSENERLLLEKWANLQRLSYTTLALLHSLGCVGGEATFEAILNMAPFSKGRIEKVSGLEKYILAALTGVVVRNPGLRGRAVDFLKPLLQSTRPAAIRVASVVALSYLYDADCDDILLDCAWQGFAGRDERPAKQARSEVNAIIMLKVEAIKALAQSTNPEVAHSIQQIIENLKQEDDLSGRTWIEWMGHTFNRVTTRKHASTRTLIFVAQRTLRAYDPQSAA